MTKLALWARDLAAASLADALPRRWRHVQAVARKADDLRPVMGADADLLVAAAWLHDVGYAPTIAAAGFHPLDGARHLSSLGSEPRLCGLVANHSGARYEAEIRGLIAELSAFTDEATLARDALWYADMTTSPDGLPVSFDERIAEIRERYGPDHPVSVGIGQAAGEIRAAIARVMEAVDAGR